MHDMEDILFFETVRKVNMRNYRSKPKKGIYDFREGGYKTFNNPEQSRSGNNAMKQEENDQYCKDRYIFVSLTSLVSSQSINLKTSAHDFSKYPVLRYYAAGSVSLQVAISVVLSVASLTIF